jgi:transposase
MPYRKISRDVKLAAIRLYERDIMPLGDVLDCLNISRSTWHRLYQLWQTTGDVVRHTFGICGRPRIFHYSDVEYLKSILSHRPDWFLDELQSLLLTNHFISVHFITIQRELLRAGISYKKIRRIASERSEVLHADFIRRMAQYLPEQLGFLDEMSKDERTSFRPRGRSAKGRRAIKKGVFVRGRRFSVEGLLTIDGMISNTVVEGSMTKSMFLEYLETSVVHFVTFLCLI